MRHLAFPALALLVLAPACSARRVGTCPSSETTADIAARLDRGAWMRSKGREVWKVLEEQSVNGQSRPPKHVGYLIARAYRQERGGPNFRVFEVTSLNQDEVLGRIDELGRVTRYEAQRNGTFVEAPLAASTRENDVGAILGSKRTITLERTNERRLAFEALDTNRDGVLQPAEVASFGSRLTGADTNHDKVVDFAEFDAIDAL